jgi:hypothetical protein
VGVVEVRELLYRHLDYLAKYVEAAQRIDGVLADVLDTLNRPALVLPDMGVCRGSPSKARPPEDIVVKAVVSPPEWFRRFFGVGEAGRGLEVGVALRPCSTSGDCLDKEYGSLWVNVPLTPSAPIRVKTVAALALLGEEAWGSVLSEVQENAKEFYSGVEVLHRAASAIRGVLLEESTGVGDAGLNLGHADRTLFGHVVSYMERMLDYVALEERMLARQVGEVYLAPSEPFVRRPRLQVRLWSRRSEHQYKPPFMHKCISVDKEVSVPDWVSARRYTRLLDICIDGFDVHLRLRASSVPMEYREDLVYMRKMYLDDLLVALYVMDDDAWRAVLGTLYEWLAYLAAVKEGVSRVAEAIRRVALAETLI